MDHRNIKSIGAAVAAIALIGLLDAPAHARRDGERTDASRAGEHNPHPAR